MVNEENKIYYRQLDAEQRRVYVDVVQAYEALQDARDQARHYAGYMTWKTARGKQYLFKGRPGARGVGSSLGPRNPETEAQYAAFYAGKEAATARVKSLEEQVELKSKYALANRLNRVPREATQTCRALSSSGCKYTIVGSNALYGYEALAAIQFESNVVATGDLDVLLDTRARLRISADEDSSRFLEILQRADKSFEVSDHQTFRAINDKGYMVDLITAPVAPIHMPNEFARTLEGDLDIAEIEKLEWLVSAPRVETWPLGFDGVPVRMLVPDPRAFAVHKYYVSKRADREPVKKQRDELQAGLLVSVIRAHLPQYAFSERALRNFPGTLLEDFANAESERSGERLW